jgi:hypothetical protein
MPPAIPTGTRLRTYDTTPDRLIGHDNSSLGEEILYVAEAQTEAMVRPECIADDLGRETIAGITRSLARVLFDLLPGSRAPGNGINTSESQRTRANLQFAMDNGRTAQSPILRNSLISKSDSFLTTHKYFNNPPSRSRR